MEILSLRSSKGYTDVGLKSIAYGCAKLRVLDLAGNFQLKCDIFLMAPKYLPKIEQVYANTFKNVSS